MQLKASVWRQSQLMSRPDYEINYYRDKDFGTVEMHSHDFYELYFFMGGEASYIIENGHYKLAKGDVLLISPANLHQLDVDDSGHYYERIVLWINPHFLEKLSTPTTDLSFPFSYCTKLRNHLIRDQQLSNFLETHLLSLLSADKNEQFGDDIEARTLLQRILLEISRYLQGNKEGLQKPDVNPTIVKTMDYIDEHLTENLSLQRLAETLFIDKYYLSHLFKKETNTTPHQYILKKRLLLSKRYIEEGSPIREVYQKSGFADYTHFFRAFKQEYGITPKDYLEFSKGEDY
jgi:AraC-like DNA-binding protein